MTDHKLLTSFEIADALSKHRPTDEQSKIIELGLVPRLVVAGAGSGKTATMVDRVVWLVANGFVRADEVLGVTFTRKAAGELRERMRNGIETLRVQGLYTPEPGDEGISTDPVVSTYHSYAHTLVQNYGLRLGVEQDAQMLGQTQAWQLVAQLVEYYEGELPSKGMSKKNLIGAVVQLAGDCAEHLVPLEKVQEYCLNQYYALTNLGKPGAVTNRNKLAENIHARVIVAELVQRYIRLKQSMQVLDYGDLIAHAARIAATVPQAAESERARFKVVLLDEFQDTSHAQMRLFSDLFGGTQRAIDAKVREPHPVMAVGDPKQSIYGFRGASAGQLFSFYEYFPTEDPTPSFLSTAWRNDTAILDAANTVAAPLAQQPEWARSSSEVTLPDLQPRPKAGQGSVLAGAYETEEQEAAAIAGLIAERRAQAGDQPVPTMAVLTRTKNSMEPLRVAFDAAEIPYQVVGLGGLLDTPEVVDLTSIMHVLSDPGRSDALMRILTGARWRIGVDDLLALAEWSKFLEKRREILVREGIELELSGMQEGLDVEELLSIATQSAASAQELIAQHSQARTPAALEEKTRQAAKARWNQVKAAAESDIVDNSSLIEALENLPDQNWASPLTGRSFTKTGYLRLRRIADELDYLRQFMADDLVTLMHRIEETTLMDIEIAAKSQVNALTARRHLDAFHEAAQTYLASAPRINATLLAGRDGVIESEDATGEVRFSLNASSASATGVAGFLAWCEQAAEQEKGLSVSGEEPRRDVVQILTVHAAKGLEWDHVYVPALSSGNFPSDKDEPWTQNAKMLPWALRGDAQYLPPFNPETAENLKEFNDDLELFKELGQEYSLAEERRLAYVAFTRARSLLVLTYSHWLGSKKPPGRISPFLRDLVDLDARGRALYFRHLQQLEAVPYDLMDAELLPEGIDGVDLLSAAQEAEKAGEAQVPLEVLNTVAHHQTLGENPLQAAVVTALWPFDPLEGPQVRRWASAQELDRASAEAALRDEQPEHGDPAAESQSLTELFLSSRRARLNRAAHNVVRGGLEEGEPTPDASDSLEQRTYAQSAETARHWQEETELLLSILNAPAIEKKTELPEHLSASQLVALSDNPVQVMEQFRRPMPMRPTIAARQGTAFHSWIEDYYDQQSVLDFEEDFADDEVEETLNMDQLRENFKSSRWADLQPWKVEYPIETPVDGISVRGRVDAIFKQVEQDGTESWEMVDWKTGRVPTKQELAHKQVQLAVYRLGFSRLMQVPLENVSATFYYVASGEERQLDTKRYPDAAALETLIRRARKAGQNAGWGADQSAN
ncbi:ATP-dependent DNA helicase [Rothia sp. ZJ1223]|uniref:ATP-dependent DNA helicase n=1 Tax=Rothia sp. ZJ1223 TaxID=2811098 RepID=UPI001958DF20|nr:ATP-dependent DNA helicase [Rothia sp. ZJ1223]MBM7051072.1 ATP-dependent helicase [Rothia sp. ZJ1223]